MKKLVACAFMAAMVVSASAAMASGVEKYGVVGVECKQVGCVAPMLLAKKNNIHAFVSNQNLQIMFMHDNKENIDKFIKDNKLTAINDTYEKIKQMQKQ
jgi:hypothetical protein